MGRTESFEISLALRMHRASLCRGAVLTDVLTGLMSLKVQGKCGGWSALTALDGEDPA